MDNVNNLLEGASPYQVLQEQAGKLAGKWDKSGLLEGIESSTEKNNMSMLLENQAKQLVNEANVTGTGTTIQTGNSEAWAGVALPLVRRVFGEIVAKDLVSVQPMNLPAGLIFYLDFQYGSNSMFKSNAAGSNSLYGATEDMKRTDGNFNTGLYGAGEFGYSARSASITLDPKAANAAPTTGTFNSQSAAFTGILNFDTEFSSSNAGLFGAGGGDQIIRYVVPTSKLEEADLEKKLLKGVTFKKIESRWSSPKYPDFEVKWDEKIRDVKKLRVLRFSASKKSADIELTRQGKDWDGKIWTDVRKINRVRVDNFKNKVKYTLKTL